MISHQELYSLIDALETGAGQACRPIIGPLDGRLSHAGSGVLLEVGDELFAVTAAHVLRGLETPSILGDRRFVSIEGQGFGAFADGPDQTDFAVIRLPEPSRNALAEVSRVRSDQLALDDVAAPDSVYVVCGYPGSRLVRCREII